MTREKKLLLLSLLTLALRLPGVFRNGEIMDEGKALFAVGRPWGQTVQLLLEKDAHPPLYLAAVHLIGFITDDIRFIRLFSVLLGVICVIALFHLAEEVFGSRAAFYAGFLFAVSPQLVFVFQYPRSYALATLVFVFFLQAAVKLLVSQDRKGWTGASFSAAFCALILMYTFYFSIFVLFPAILILLWLVRKEHKKAVFLGVALTGAFLAYLPWIPYYRLQMEYLSAGTGGTNPLLHARQVGFYVQGIHLGNFAKLFAGLLQFEDILGQSRRFSAVLPGPLIAVALVILTGLCAGVTVACIKAARRLQLVPGVVLLFGGTVAGATLLLGAQTIFGDMGISLPIHLNMRYLAQISVIVVMFLGVLLASFSLRKGVLVLAGCCATYLPQVAYINAYPRNVNQEAAAFIGEHKARVIVSVPKTPEWLVEKYKDTDTRFMEFRDRAQAEKVLVRLAEDLAPLATVATTATYGRVCVYFTSTAEHMIWFGEAYRWLTENLGRLGFSEFGSKDIGGNVTVRCFYRQ